MIDDLCLSINFGFRIDATGRKHEKTALLMLELEFDELSPFESGASCIFVPFTTSAWITVTVGSDFNALESDFDFKAPIRTATRQESGRPVPNG